MTIQQCKYVLKILDCGSFSQAASQLFVAQSSLSVSIKALEKELNIKIFERSGTGVCLTPEGSEFIRYAQQLVAQSNFISNRYYTQTPNSRLFVSTQHYDFVADIFSELVNETTEAQYRFSLREMKTYDVIKETENAYCDIGVLAIKSSDTGIMERYLSKKNLCFSTVLKASAHIYVRADHPLARFPRIIPEQLQNYPVLSYEQGKHSSSFFTEELISGYSKQQVEISDRASLMNVLLATHCYTVGTGFMPSMLNSGRIVSIPLASDGYYNIGYITRNDRTLSPLAHRFADKLQQLKALLPEQV